MLEDSLYLLHGLGLTCSTRCCSIRDSTACWRCAFAPPAPPGAAASSRRTARGTSPPTLTTTTPIAPEVSTAAVLEGQSIFPARTVDGALTGRDERGALRLEGVGAGRGAVRRRRLELVLLLLRRGARGGSAAACYCIRPPHPGRERSGQSAALGAWSGLALRGYALDAQGMHKGICIGCIRKANMQDKAPHRLTRDHPVGRERRDQREQSGTKEMMQPLSNAYPRAISLVARTGSHETTRWVGSGGTTPSSSGAGGSSSSASGSGTSVTRRLREEAVVS